MDQAPGSPAPTAAIIDVQRRQVGRPAAVKQHALFPAADHGAGIICVGSVKRDPAEDGNGLILHEQEARLFHQVKLQSAAADGAGQAAVRCCSHFEAGLAGRGA